MLYNVDNKINNEIQTLKKHLTTYEARMDAWEHVKPLTKKNGDAFSVFSKNFDGCTVGPKSFGNKGNIHLNVHYSTPTCSYASDSISVSDKVYDDSVLECIPENRIKYDEYGNAWIIKSLDETWKLIEETIERDHEYAEEARKALEKAPEVMNQVVEIAKQYDALKTSLNESSLEYRAESLMKELMKGY